MQKPVYLDYMATTPVDPRVAAKMSECLLIDGTFGNPASANHPYGWEAFERVQAAREQVAHLVGADAREIIWTSGATESNNLAIQGAARFYQRKGKHLITLATEHKAVLDVFDYLARQGFSVTYLKPESNGLLDIDKLAEAIRPDTVLVSVMQVNNEIGVIQDVAAIGSLCRAKGVLFHVDAAQSAGKLPIKLSEWPIDLMSFSAHKVYGPKGIGALYLRRKPKLHLEPLFYGGGQEQGLRSGTLATHQIVGMGEAFHLAEEVLDSEPRRIFQLRQRLWEGIKELPGLSLNGDWEQRVAGNLNVCFKGMDAEALIVSLRELAISSGSACDSATIQPSHVLMALGLSRAEANSSLRFSLGRYTTEAEVDFAIAEVSKQVRRLQQLRDR